MATHGDDWRDGRSCGRGRIALPPPHHLSRGSSRALAIWRFATADLSDLTGKLGRKFYAGGVLSINRDQLHVLVERVDSILAARRGLLPAVQREIDDAARRRGEVERLVSLLRELKEIEKDQNALQRIDGALEDLERLLSSFSGREETLNALSVRFGRDTVNIGVSGEARVGKSTTLQKFSGLTDTQIPTGKGLPVTAVRSEIFNSVDERAEVTFRDQETFIAEYIRPLLEIVNKHLDVPLAVDTMAGLRTSKFPETLGSNVDSVSTDSLSRLLDAQKSIDTYAPRLTGGLKQVALDDLRSYVAYPSKEDLDTEKATGTPSSRSYIAVESVKIFCHFPRLEGVKIGLVDLPGLRRNRRLGGRHASAWP